jgi:DNA polymerase III, delta subunit
MPFPTIVGQDRVCRLLDAYVRQEGIPSLIFVGPAGIGKRTVALELTRLVNCTGDEPRPCGRCNSCRTISRLRHPDIKLVFPIGPLSRRSQGEDEGDKSDAVAATLDRYPEFELGQAQPALDSKYLIRRPMIVWLREDMARPPHAARRRFFIILHAHRMNDEAANALLKILEEPHEKTTFVLTTDSPNQLLPTIRSRCQSLRFSALGTTDVFTLLTERFGVDRAKAEPAAAFGQGSTGRALRFARRESDVLAPAAAAYFADSAGTDREILNAIGELDRTPQWLLTDTFLFLFRETLRAKLELDSAYARLNPAVAERAARSDLNYLRRALQYILKRDQDSALYTNPRLSSFSLLSALRPPQTKPARPARSHRPPTRQTK